MDTKTIALNGFKNACKLFLSDLEALPDEAYTRSLGGKARSVADIVYEVNLVNDHVGLGMRGEEQFEWPEGWIKAPADLQAKDAVIESFRKSSDRIVDTIEGFSKEQIEEPYRHEEKETTRFERIRFMTLHVWYHGGQLNFIQTLLGDDDWHWK